MDQKDLQNKYGTWLPGQFPILELEDGKPITHSNPINYSLSLDILPKNGEEWRSNQGP